MCAIQASLYPVACLTGILSNAIQLPLSQWYYVSSVVPFLPTCSSCVLHIAVFGHGLNFSKIRQTLITTQVSFRRKRHCFVTGHCCLISSTLLVPPTYIPGENVVALMAYLCPIGIEGTLFTDQQRPHEPSTSVLDWLDCWEVKIGQAGGGLHLSGWRSQALSTCRWRFHLAWHEPLVSEILRMQTHTHKNLKIDHQNRTLSLTSLKSGRQM